jgi:hypothetical protein
MKLRTWICLTAIALAPVSSARADFINGNFETGNLSGWTTYTTANGTIGTPTVVSFDTTGSGASLAARLQVGQLSFQSGVFAGGGILQSLNLAVGTYVLTADFAAFNANTSGSNASGGRFSLLLDGVTLDSTTFGSITGQQTLRDNFNLTLNITTAGLHEFRFQAERPFLMANVFQFWDNIQISSLQAVPAPSGVILAGLGVVGALGLRRRFRTNVVA